MKNKRRLNYTPCKCPVWKFPHKPEDKCYERLADFDWDKYTKQRIEYADANGGGRAENFDQRIDSKTYYRNR